MFTHNLHNFSELEDRIALLHMQQKEVNTSVVSLESQIRHLREMLKYAEQYQKYKINNVEAINVKKIEIIERITDANGSISENILTSWEHKNQLIPKIIRFEELKIYLQERIVKKNDSDVHLSKYEYDILLLLAKSPGRIFGKEMVYDLVWNEPYSGDYNVVMRHICNIREKIEDDPAHPLYIQTVRGVGYRFNGNLGSE